jgi:ribonuclease HI
LRHDALKIIYNGAILQQLLYVAPVWIESMKKQYNKAKYIKVQRLINLRMAKAYRMISHKALCILTGILPINIRAEEAAALYNITTGRIIQKYQRDKEENPRNWLHPADTLKVNDSAAKTTDDREDSKHNIHVYTDGSKSEHGVGSGIVIFKDDKITHTKKWRLDGRCSNNQAEQLAILKALENIQNMDTNDRTVQIFRDSRITLESLKNRKNHTHLIGKIRNKATELEKHNWKIKFNAGHQGNELADKLAKEAATNNNIIECYNKIPKSTVKI